jgi:hypothetical protein
MNNFRHPVKMAVLAVACAVCNVLISMVFVRWLGLPLYLDTLFTMTVAFLGGPFWGALTGFFTNMMLHSIWYGGPLYYLFTLCNIAVALVTALFVRLFPAELDVSASAAVPASKSQRFVSLLDRCIVLILLSFSLCLSISLLGGLTGTLIKTIIPDPNSGTELRFLPTLIRKNLPLVLVETLSRIPVNVIDRPVSAFCAYLTARLLWRAARGGDVDNGFTPKAREAN